MSEFNVFSCFDGISCCQQALVNSGIKYDKYYASEIDQRAIKVTQTRWPKTIQFGSITKIKAEHFMSPIHLLAGGSPCQGFSFAGKQLNFDDPRSKLFFEFVRLKNELNPTYFFLENVRMVKESQKVITDLLGVEPIFVNSALVSAQNRQRLYWTNIPGFVMPEDRGIVLNDILEFDGINIKDKSNTVRTSTRGSNDRHEWDNIYKKSKKLCNVNPSGIKGNVNATDFKCPTLTTNKGEGLKIGVKQLNPSKESGGQQPYMQNRVYDIAGKGIALTSKSGNYNIITHSTQPRNGKGQGGKGHLQKEDGKSYALDTSCTTTVEYADTYRKLTVTECERLQGVPDGYTKAISKSAAYHALGNGWQVDTIVEFFKHIPPPIG